MAKRSTRDRRAESYAALSLVPLLAVATPAAGQQQDAQLWTQINTNVPLTDEVRVTLEQIARFSDRQDGLYQTEFLSLIHI